MRLNNNTHNLKFTMDYHPQTISFFELHIYKDTNNTVATTLFCKLSAGNTILHVHSDHHFVLIQSILYAQYVRLQRNCTHLHDFTIQAAQLCQCLIQLGCSKSTLCKANNKALKESRTNFLYQTQTTLSQPTFKLITRNSANIIS